MESIFKKGTDLSKLHHNIPQTFPSPNSKSNRCPQDPAQNPSHQPRSKTAKRCTIKINLISARKTACNFERSLSTINAKVTEQYVLNHKTSNKLLNPNHLSKHNHILLLVSF
jgi:hypothetical protein